MGKAIRNKIFHRLVLGPVMTGTDRDMLTKLLKIKPPTFVSSETVMCLSSLLIVTRGCTK